jgi:hypothetical protein
VEASRLNGLSISFGFAHRTPPDPAWLTFGFTTNESS